MKFIKCFCFVLFYRIGSKYLSQEAFPYHKTNYMSIFLSGVISFLLTVILLFWNNMICNENCIRGNGKKTNVLRDCCQRI